MKQVGFIVGTGRCGTTILAQVLNSHSEICVPCELQIICGIGNGDRLHERYIAGDFEKYGSEDFISLFEKRCPYYFDRYFDYREHFRQLKYPQKDLRRLLTVLFDHICYDQKKTIFLEQTPWYGQRLDLLQELFPEMKVVHIIRDGRDVAISYARTPWWSNDIAGNLIRWDKEVNVIHSFGQRNPENYIEVRYEDLLTDPARELSRILDFFGIFIEDEMLDAGNLIEYSDMFKGNYNEYISNENMKWKREKRNVFFNENIQSWKNYSGYDFMNIPDTVNKTLMNFHY